MKNSFLLLSVLLCLFACKKDKRTETSEPSTPQSNTSQTTPGLGPSNVHGVFLAQRINISQMGEGYSSQACFNTSAERFTNCYMMGGIITPLGVNAGTLQINNTILQFDSATLDQSNRYNDTLPTKNYSTGVTWKLKAAQDFSSFSANVTRGFPRISNPDYLPQMISRSNGCVVKTESNYSNTDSLIVYLGGAGGFALVKHFAGDAKSFSFSPSELSSLTVQDDYSLLVLGINYSHQSISGKNYVFVMEYDLYSFVKITP